MWKWLNETSVGTKIIIAVLVAVIILLCLFSYALFLSAPPIHVVRARAQISGWGGLASFVSYSLFVFLLFLPEMAVVGGESYKQAYKRQSSTEREDKC